MLPKGGHNLSEQVGTYKRQFSNSYATVRSKKYNKNILSNKAVGKRTIVRLLGCLSKLLI